MLEVKENANLMEFAIQCADDANAIQYAHLKLNAVQYAVSRLVEQLNELDHKSFDGMGKLIIGQIDSQVRMIDMALYPLTNDFGEISKSLVENTEKLYRGFQNGNDFI